MCACAGATEKCDFDLKINVPKEILITELKFHFNSSSGSSVIKINSGEGVYSQKVNILDLMPDAQKVFRSKNDTF